MLVFPQLCVRWYNFIFTNWWWCLTATLWARRPWFDQSIKKSLTAVRPCSALSIARTDTQATSEDAKFVIMSKTNTVCPYFAYYNKYCILQQIKIAEENDLLIYHFIFFKISYKFTLDMVRRSQTFNANRTIALWLTMCIISRSDSLLDTCPTSSVNNLKPAEPKSQTVAVLLCCSAQLHYKLHNAQSCNMSKYVNGNFVNEQSLFVFVSLFIN